MGAVLESEEVEISLEDHPQADTGPQPAIIEKEGRARGRVGGSVGLVDGNRQQHAYDAALRRRYRDDPLSTELLSKKSLFYGPRRSCRKGASQRVRSLRELGIDGRYVQDCYQSSVGAEYRRAGAAQVYVSRSEMLASVDGASALFDDAGADAVRALHLLGPHAAKPSTPILEAASLRIGTAMLHCDSRAVTE